MPGGPAGFDKARGRAHNRREKYQPAPEPLMTKPLFDVPAAPQIPVLGQDGSFPVRRIFCVGRNYAAHAAEMGNEVDREAPFYFT